MRKLIKIITGILIAIFIFALFTRILSYNKEYITPFDPAYWKSRYLQSQWVIPDSKNSIGDDGLYAYVSWEYIHGSDPTLLNAEIPPLGKYVIGVGELVFRNQNILILLVGLTCLGVFYILNIQIFKNKILAFLPVLLFSLDPLFYEQFRAPYLDTTYLLFLLLTFLFSLKKKYVLTAIFLGCFASTKYPLVSVFLFLPILLWVIIYDKSHVKKLIRSMFIWPLVFIISYTAFFIHGGSIFKFLGVQKWILEFYIAGAKSVPGIVYPMILSGNWSTWFSGLVKVKEWNVLWPTSFIASLFTIIAIAYNLKSGKNKSADKEIILTIFWILSYLTFLSFTPVFPRYLLLLLPFMYNLLIWFLAKFVFQRF